ncbi:hypothetical protein [Nocardioides stalactiti]|uniref:hypothetical protein n=1 Tax=Nocardioides stalactiti TaxID=2755356 RepID=UPI001602C920|nr:hypothetical protein [Nocardioides stalactiti]
MTGSEGVDADDGLRGPVGQRFAHALAVAGQRLELDVRGLDRVDDFFSSVEWIDQEWRGRRLTVRVATYGAAGTTTGYRWVVVRLETKVRLGRWADPVMRSNSPLEGIFLPVTLDPVGEQGTWADDPALSEDLGAYAEPMPEGFVALQVRNDAVLWQLRASAMDGDRLTAAILLLDRVAGYAEQHDAALSQRLGRAAGVTGWRTFELAFVVLVLGGIAAMILAPFLLAYLF